MENQAAITWDSYGGAVFPLAMNVLAGDVEDPPVAQAAEAQWYAIQTRYRCERQVTVQLEKKGLETFLPVLREIHRWSDRKKAVDIPLFSGYTFARLNLVSDDRLDVLRTNGVIGLVTFGSQPIPVPDKQVDDLHRLLSQQIPCSLQPFLQIGRKVRIRGGCLDGLEGILQQNDCKSLVIAIDSLQRSVAIKIEGYELELV